MASIVTRMGHEATSAHSLSHGLDALRLGGFDVVLLDVRLPDGNGLSILQHIRETTSEPEVIIMTGHGDPDGAELAIRNGAWDYIEKPSSLQQMTLPLVRAIQFREEKRKRPVVVLNREGIVGCSPRMKSCMDVLGQAAGSDASVLITGETGTGKELFALAVHRNSPRSGQSFVVVDCTALPETLVESLLFGHVRGAFTGADKTQEGLIRQADGGTLFLDEVGELPLSMQKTFLRVLQGRRYRPIGSRQEMESDFRLIAATNRDLDQMVERGHFRKDLLFRMRSFTIELPSLRDRREDIRDLVLYYSAEICEKYGIGMKGFSPELLDALTSYEWPGNVRELMNAVERTISVARYEPTLYPYHLPTHIRVQMARASVKRDPRESYGGCETGAAMQSPDAEGMEIVPGAASGADRWLAAVMGPASETSGESAGKPDMETGCEPMRPVPSLHAVDSLAPPGSAQYSPSVDFDHSPHAGSPAHWLNDLPELSVVRDGAIAAIEKKYLTRLMAITGGNMKEASQIAGLSLPRLYALLKKHGVTKAASSS